MHFVVFTFENHFQTFSKNSHFHQDRPPTTDSFFENQEFSLFLNFLKRNNDRIQLIEKKINHEKRMLLKIEEIKKIKDLNDLFNKLEIF